MKRKKSNKIAICIENAKTFLLLMFAKKRRKSNSEIYQYIFVIEIYLKRIIKTGLERSLFHWEDEDEELLAFGSGLCWEHSSSSSLYSSLSLSSVVNDVNELMMSFEIVSVAQLMSLQSH